MQVQLSYEEKIINAVVYHDRPKRGESIIDHDKRLFDAIRRVLRPLYDELDELRALNLK